MLYGLKDILKAYDGRAVLSLKSLSLEQGKIISLLGPNGAGKTTLLELLAFLSPPTSGEIWFREERVEFRSKRIITLRRKVSLVQQNPILFSTTVFNNIAFPLKIRKIPRKEREMQVNQLLEIVGMSAFKQVKAHKLSGGETQRVAIAQALACIPEVILLDEPTSSVDIENAGIIERIIKDINLTKGISVLFTTHDMIQASRLSDQTVFVIDGRIADSIFENIFSGYVENPTNGYGDFVIQNGLKLKVKAGRSGPSRISIDPAGIQICQAESVEAQNNTFRGKLIQLTEERNRIRALVDVGIPINVLIAADAFNTFSLVIGEEVWLTCPPDKIEVF